MVDFFRADEPSPDDERMVTQSLTRHPDRRTGKLHDCKVYIHPKAFAILDAYLEMINRYDEGRKRTMGDLLAEAGVEMIAAWDRAGTGDSLRRHAPDKVAFVRSMINRYNAKKDWATREELQKEHLEGSAECRRRVVDATNKGDFKDASRRVNQWKEHISKMRDDYPEDAEKAMEAAKGDAEFQSARKELGQ